MQTMRFPRACRYVSTCAGCGIFLILSTHTHTPGTIGVHVDPSAVDAWVCELCENEETLEASIVSHGSVKYYRNFI
jgi:hypothetical protein